MNNYIPITLKKVRVLQKNNATLESAAEHFRYTDIDTFISDLQQQLFKCEPEKIISEFQENSLAAKKKAQKRAKKVANSTVEEVELDNEEIIGDDLDSFKRLENYLSSKVCSLEEEEASIYHSLQKLEKEKEVINQAISSIISNLKLQKTKFEELLSKKTELSDSLNSVQTQLKEDSSELERVREKIQELQRIVIYAYSSGEIEFEKGNFEFSQNEVNEIFNNLLSNHQVGNLTLNQIRQLSQLLSLKSFSNLFTIEFENDAVKKVYEQLAK